MINEILLDVNEYKKTINFVDIDDTIFKTDTRVRIVDNKYKIKHRIKSCDFISYKLKTGEYYDFSEYTNSDIFYTTAKPIKNVINNITNLIDKINFLKCSDKIIFLTAREDMDNKDRFLKTFLDHNIPVNNKKLIYIERAGNLGLVAHKAKPIIIEKYLNNTNYNRVRLIDDSNKNLLEFIKLINKYPEIEFTAIKVNKNGELIRFNEKYNR